MPRWPAGGSTPSGSGTCSPARGLYYHPSRHSAGQPIVAGWAFQWVCQLGFARDSWTAPVDAARLHPADDNDQQAACQVRALLGRLGAGGPVPWFVFDAGYDSAQRRWTWPGRPWRCWYGCAPTAAATLSRPTPARHRWPAAPPRRHVRRRRPDHLAHPTATLVWEDDQYGTVTVAAWSGLHPKQHRHPGHGSGRPRPIVRGTVIRVQVERVPARTRPPKVLWLWWAGPGELDLDLAWRAYTRRFDCEHTIGFCKQTLGWTSPRVRTPAQAERWTWLVLAWASPDSSEGRLSGAGR